MANDQTIIIKKINKGAHAAHGGAWKVAYADFVTAMMAFFLLLWLLNATEAEQLAGLADYFAPTVGVWGNKGIGFRGGKALISSGVGASKNTNKGIIFQAPTKGTVVKNPEEIDIENDLLEQEKIEIVEKEGEQVESLEEVQEIINKEFARDDALKELRENIYVHQVPDGLKIQIVDKERQPMFKEGSAELNKNSKIILEKIVQIIALLPNYISIAGHTNSLPLGRGKNYTIWELSADRANVVRRFIIDQGIVKEQILRVVGKADHDPIDPNKPESIINNRVDIILLRDAYLTRHKRGAPNEVFVDLESAKKEELINVTPVEEEKKMVPLAETPVPETQGRDFFGGIVDEGLDYESIDPERARETGVPGGFFVKETPIDDSLKDDTLFGEGNKPAEESITEEQLKGDKAVKFREETIEGEIEDIETIAPDKEDSGILPDWLFFQDSFPEQTLEKTPVDDVKGVVDEIRERKQENKEVNKFKEEVIKKDAEKIKDYQTIEQVEDGNGSLPEEFFGEEAGKMEGELDKDLFGEKNLGPVEPLEEIIGQESEKDKKSESNIKKKKKFFEEDLEQLPESDKVTPEDLLNSGGSSLPLDFFNNLGL